MTPLNSRQQETCIYAGIFGVLIAATCLIQHIAITREHWISFTMLAIYLFSITAFVVLALQKSLAPLLLIISAVLVLIAELFLILSTVFSLIVLILFLYTLVITILLFIEQYPQKLKAMAMARKAEQREWDGIL